jgi:hypothetical protein
MRSRTGLRSRSLIDWGTEVLREFLQTPDQPLNDIVNCIELCEAAVCTENLIRVDEAMESPKLAE